MTCVCFILGSNILLLFVQKYYFILPLCKALFWSDYCNVQGIFLVSIVKNLLFVQQAGLPGFAYEVEYCKIPKNKQQCHCIIMHIYFFGPQSPESLNTLNGAPCPGMITSAVFKAVCRLTCCTSGFSLSSLHESSSAQHSNRSPATRTCPTTVPLTRTLTSRPVWPGVGMMDTQWIIKISASVP